MALTAGGIYQFQVTVTSPDGLANTARADFMINSPPQSGSVSITPATGTALSTTFTLTATGYDDPQQPISYQVHLCFCVFGWV